LGNPERFRGHRRPVDGLKPHPKPITLGRSRKRLSGQRGAPTHLDAGAPASRNRPRRGGVGLAVDAGDLARLRWGNFPTCSEVVYDRHRLADPSSLMTGAGGLHRRLQPAPSRHLRKHRPGAATKDPICWTTTHNSHPQATEPPLTRQTPAQVFPPRPALKTAQRPGKRRSEAFQRPWFPPWGEKGRNAGEWSGWPARGSPPTPCAAGSGGVVVTSVCSSGLATDCCVRVAVRAKAVRRRGES